MKELSSRQTFLTKYVVTALWCFGSIAMAITVYNKFGQVEGFYMAPLFFLPAMVSYMPMRISYDETKIVVSDWFTNDEYKFMDIKSLKYSRPMISYHPYTQLELTMTDNRLMKIKFIPRTTDSFKSLFSMEVQGRKKELKDLWYERTTTNKS
jgi:hypothetical protein